MKSVFYVENSNLLSFNKATKICSLLLRGDYTPLSEMKASIWKSIGMGVTEVPLPPSILAQIKKEIPDDLHALKYVVFDLSAKNPKGSPQDNLDQILSIADTAKQYSLNQIEFRNACRNFLKPNSPETIQGLAEQKKQDVKKGKVAPLASSFLPVPKRGLILYRRDSRRRGSCSVVAVAEGVASVRWHHNNKVTKIAVENLRSPRLYSTKKIF